MILLEDCSHAHGAKYKDKPVGSFGDAAAWSLQGQKIITGGEGGILLTNNQEIYYRANLLGHYNKRCKDEIPKNHNLYKYAITGFGLKLRAHPLAIALANEQFDNLDNWIQQKNIYVKKIIKELKNIPFLSFLNNSNTVPSYYGLIIKYDSFLANNISRENFVDKLHKEGLIEVDIPNSTSPIDQYEIFTHPKASSFRQNATSNQKLKIEAFPQAYKFFNSILKIPIWVRKQDKNIIDLYIQGFKKISKTIMKNYKSNLENIISIELKKINQEGIQKIVVGVTILFENKVLCLTRNADDFMGGLVELPSGGVDENEKVLESLKREIMEETSLQLLDNEFNQVSFISSFDYTSGSGKKARQLNFRINLNQSPNIVLNPSEHSSYFWLSVENLDNYNISSETKKVIRAVLE